ncbi:MAG TPA: hypothetical protein VIS49_06790 [Cyclobacteriaceae bacterium]
MKWITIAVFVIISSSLAAQSSSESATVMMANDYLFDGMTKGDSALVQKAFMDEATFASIGPDKDGNQTF